MELANRPLLDNAPDAELFVPDETMEPLVRAAQAHLNVLLIGEAGRGKTTLLRQTLYRSRGTGRRTTVFVNGTAASDAVGLLELLRDDLARTGLVRDFPAWSGPGPGMSWGGTESARLLALVRGLVTDPPEPLTIVLDGLPSAEAARTLFGRLRDELWQLPHNWIVATTPRDRAVLLTPPADAFFDLRLELEAAPDPVLEQILRRRLGDPPSLAEPDLRRIVVHSEGNPRLALSLARDILFDPRTASRRLDARWRREQVAAELGRSHSMLLAELEERPPVSASDRNLLDALGWTRSRATQVLRELEKASVVKGFRGRSERGGTLKLYEVADPRNDEC